MITIIVVAQLSIVASAPSVSPEEALRILRGSPARVWEVKPRQGSDEERPVFVLSKPFTRSLNLIEPAVRVPPKPEPESLSWQAEPCGGPRGPVCASVAIEDRRHRSH